MSDREEKKDVEKVRELVKRQELELKRTRE